MGKSWTKPRDFERKSREKTRELERKWRNEHCGVGVVAELDALDIGQTRQPVVAFEKYAVNEIHKIQLGLPAKNPMFCLKPKLSQLFSTTSIIVKFEFNHKTQTAVCAHRNGAFVFLRFAASNVSTIEHQIEFCTLQGVQCLKMNDALISITLIQGTHHVYRISLALDNGSQSKPFTIFTQKASKDFFRCTAIMEGFAAVAEAGRLTYTHLNTFKSKTLTISKSDILSLEFHDRNIYAGCRNGKIYCVSYIDTHASCTIFSSHESPIIGLSSGLNLTIITLNGQILRRNLVDRIENIAHTFIDPAFKIDSYESFITAKCGSTINIWDFETGRIEFEYVIPNGYDWGEVKFQCVRGFGLIFSTEEGIFSLRFC